MRRIGLFSILVMAMLCANMVDAQDLIVTIQGDSLNVKIQKETDQFIYYHTAKSKKKDIVISRKEIADIQFGFFVKEGDEYVPDHIVQNGSAKVKEKAKRFQVWGSGGFGYYLAFVDPDEEEFVKEYYRKLRLGYTFSFGANFFFTDRFGVGASFEQSAFSNTFDGIVSIDFPRDGTMDTTYTGSLRDDIILRHYGLNFLMRFPFERTGSAIQLSVGLGYNTYTNNATIVEDFLFEGNSVGIALSGEYQIALGGGLFLPFKIGLTNVSFINMKVTPSPETSKELGDFLIREFENDEIEPLSGSRFSLTVGLLYSF